MNLASETVDGVAVVSVAEPVEVDAANADDFKRGVLGAAGAAERVVLDLSLVEFFDSAGMGALLSLQKAIRERGGKIALAGLNRAVQEVFQMVGFDVLFLIFPDVPTAVASLQER